MATYVYITKQCQKEINHQQYSQQVESFRKKVESTQNLEVFDRFPPPFLKKRFERQIRLVAREYILTDHIVVVFIRLLVRGGAEYKQFGDQGYKVLPGFDGMASELSDDALTAYVNGRQDPPPPPPPKPNEAEQTFLHSALCSSENIYADAHCCETKLWVDRINSPELKDWKPAFIEAVLDTVDCVDTGLQEKRCPKDSNFGILFRRIAERNMVILFAPFKGGAPFDLVRSLYPELISDEEPAEESVLRKAKRAYPHELVLNDTAWLNVQNDEDGNMALSIEEISVLDSARVHAGGFPLFINGSAGSGKSTILQYLFAEFLFHHCQTGKPTAGPVLFACNDELLARSSTSVRSILRARLGRGGLSEVPGEWIKRHEDAINRSLRNFHEWLRRLAPADKFPVELLIDYAGFKKWWEDRFKADPGARKLYNADVSWHVIRTYIKGISTDDVLDPEDYEEIPFKQKSVTPETYRVVFDNVWRRYSEDQKAKGMWDHQDLARYVLDKELAKPDFPVVFCDEAQDFTRIELEVLHQSCLFSARTLNSFQLPQVPLAFAGDPFQTLNPTGFRWEATKAFFTDKFIKSYPGQKRGEINYQELTYNYRSSHHIVRFINSLQLTRSVIFDFPEIKPQHPWEDDENVPRVVYFERSAETLRQLKNQSEIRIVVPCEAGYEGQWAKDNGLADYVEFDDAGVPKNVVSPTGVKGLEFPRVVLYGFGAACPPILRGVLDNLRANPESSLPEMKDDQAIEPQYFWNRLYVAASRPRKRLFIFDDSRDIDSFWNQIFANQENTLLRADEVQAWEGVTGQLIKGDDQAWEGDEEDPLKTAEKLEEEGRLRKDRTLLRQAAQSFRSAKRPAEEKRCKAQALELESNFLEAAKLWRDFGDIDKSILAAWNAREGGLEFIVDLAENDTNVRNDIHWKVANFLKTKRSLSEGVVILKDVAEGLGLPRLQEEILMSGVWPHMILLVIKRLLASNDEDPGRWLIAYRNAKQLADGGLGLPHEQLGDLAFRGDETQAAFHHWEGVSIENRAQYESRFLRAKASVTPFPQSLETWGDILKRQPDKKLAEEVVSLVYREGSDRLTDTQSSAVLRAHLVLGNVTEALAGIVRTNDLSLLSTLSELAHKENNPEARTQVVERIARVLANSDDWHAFAVFYAKGVLEQVECRGLVEHLKLEPLKHSIPFVHVMAEAVGLEHSTNDVKTRLAELTLNRFPLNLTWRYEVHPLIVGRAMERAGLFRITLPFYEAVANHPGTSKELRRWAWGRWARTKVRQVALQGNRKGLEEAKEKAATYGFVTPDNVPEDLPPSLPPIEDAPAVATTKPKKASQIPSTSISSHKDESLKSHAVPTQDFARTLKIGALNLRVVPDGSRVNIEHSTSGQVLSLFTARRVATIDGEELDLNPEELFTNLPGDWALAFSFDRVEEGKMDLIADDGIELSLPVAPQPSQ